MGERRRFRPFDVQFGIAAVSGNEILQNTTSAKHHIRKRVKDPPHRRCRRAPYGSADLSSPRLMAAKISAVDQPSISVPQVAASAPKMR